MRIFPGRLLSDPIRPGLAPVLLIAGAFALPAPSLQAQSGEAPLVGDPASGEFVFDDKCGSCHLGNDNTDSGPSLIGVHGRKAGSVAEFRYTPDLSASGLIWDDATLDRFLANPQGVVPGTNMKRSLADPADRIDVIAYLREQQP